MAYNWAFSLSIARKFRDSYPRASEMVSAIYDVNLAYSAKLFQFKQKRWELYKKCVITCHRLMQRAEYSAEENEDLRLLKQKLQYILGRNEGKSIKLP